MRKSYFFICFLAITLLSVLRSYSQISVTATAGVMGPTPYTTLNGAVNAINAGTHQGAVTVSVTANTTEFVQSILNSSGTGGASYTSILIKPAAAATPTISGNITPAILQMRGSDNVTIDGSNTAGGTTRDLTMRNNSATATETVIWISSATAADGATNNTIKNCNFQGFSAGTTVSGILTGNTGAIGAAAIAANSNNTIQNNGFTNVQNGIYLFGYATAPYDANWTITDNNFTTMGFRGMILQNCSNFNISNNIISGVVANTASTPTGIMIYGGMAGGNISRNVISGVNNTAATFGCNGIWLSSSSAASGINVFNNIIYNVWSTSGFAGSMAFNSNGYGIILSPLLGAGGGYNIYFNTINLITPQAAGFGTAAINLEAGLTAGGVNLRDNILVNSQAGGATTRTAIYSSSPSTVFSAINYNDYYASSGVLGNIGGVNRTTIAQVQLGFGGNLNSITLNPVFVSGTDMHLQNVAANYPLQTGQFIASVTTDIDGATRNPTIPTMGADELPSDIVNYTTLANTCSTADVTLNPVTITSGVGVNTTGGLMPQIYFRKGAGPWFHTTGTLLSGTATSGTWSFVISPATMGGVAGGDVIQYYVIAQTTTGSIFANPTTGLVATDVNTVTTHPTTPNSYTVQAVSLSGLATAATVCYNPAAASSASFAYTGSLGTPNQYTLTWSPAGPTNVTTFSALASPISVSIPAGTAANTYTGTLTIRNSTTLCTNTYTLTLTINPPPSAITGSLGTCQGATTTVSTASSGGGWTISPTTTATVGAGSGIVTGVAAGTATVTYTFASTGCYTTAVVTVYAPPAPIAGASVVCVGATTTFTNPSSGGTWSSASGGIATVGVSSGIVTGAGAGVTTISYTLASCPAVTKSITVNPVPAAIAGPLGMCIGFTTTLTNATSGGTWSSAFPAIATINSSGVATGVTAGTSTITYQLTSTSCYATAVASVYPIPGPITGDTAVCIGATAALGNTATGGTWTSSVPGIATVGFTSGVVSGVSYGTTTITYALGSCLVTRGMRVSTAPTAITGPSIVCTGRTITLNESVTTGSWSSSDTTATVNSVGVVTGMYPGTTNITYSTLGCTPATKQVTINMSPANITGITNVCSGTSTTLSNTTPGGTWSSSNPMVPVSPTGVVTGLSVGITTVITYALPNGCITTAPIVVDASPLPIAGPDSVCQGASVTLTNTVPGGNWSSSDGTIATAIATTGQIIGASPGIVTISYTLVSGCYVTKPFKVRTPLPASVSITRFPATDPICAGTPVMFVANAVNGGPNPGFVWQKFTVDTAIGDTFTYVPTHGDFITLWMTVDSICAAPNPSTDNLYINVYPAGVTPSVTITTTTAPLDLVYLGQVFTFYSNVTYGGAAPTFQWYVNDVPVPGATSSSYSMPIYRSVLVYCRVTGNPPCATGTTGQSNTIIIHSSLGVNATAVGTSEFSLFPNPNTGAFTLNGTITGGSDQALAIEVTNMLGQVIYRGSAVPQGGAVSQQVALGSDLAPGSYIMRVSSEGVNEVFHFVVSK
ncbi:MAG: T9SS type A sorting domain-containing protein [Bacteroidota bacterium]